MGDWEEMVANLIQESPNNIALQMPSKWKTMTEEYVKIRELCKELLQKLS